MVRMNAGLRLSQAKKQYDEADRMNKKYESERDELIALRNFVYRLEQDVEEMSISTRTI